MQRQNFKAAADDDSLPVMVPRNDKAVVPISPERVRRLRKHLVVTLRSLRTMKYPDHSVSPLRPEPEGFTGRVTRTEHDDQVDSTAQFLDWYKKPFPSQGHYEYMRQRAQELQQRDKPQPTKTVWAIGSMEWLAEQKEAG